MTRPLKLLDLFCGAGGCAMGYWRAGFHDITGIDHKPQKNYPFDFHQADVFEWCVEHDLSRYDLIHASPPCQFYSVLAAMHTNIEYPDHIQDVRNKIKDNEHVIENVETAPLASSSDLFGNHGVMLCGSMFGLGIERGYLRRHRIFETSFPLPQPECLHKGRAVGVYGHGGHSGKRRMLYKKEAAEAMQINWMTRYELSQAIPPAYTEWIGKQIIRMFN